MKVTLLKSRAAFKGGLEKYTHYLAQAFAQKGCEVTLLTTGESPTLEGIQTLSLAPDSKWTAYQLLRFDALCKKWLREHPSEVVFGMERTTSQTHYRAGSGVHAVYLQRRQLVDPLWKQLSFKINPLHRILLSMEKKAFEHPNLKVLFTNSSMVKEEILKTYDTPKEKIVIVHNGVEWEALQPSFEASFQHPPRSTFQFLFIGNGYRRKGLLFLLQGLTLLKKEDFMLTVIGKDKEPSFFAAWVEKNGLGNKVRFLGPQRDVRPYYQQADALVIPSIYDPFANVTVEALAMGLFVVSSNYNGGKEVLQPFSGCVIEELTSPESAAVALRQALAVPKIETRAREIRQSIKELDFSNQLDKIISLTFR